MSDRTERQAIDDVAYELNQMNEKKMSYREHVAALCMANMSKDVGEWMPEKLASIAVIAADALITELAKPKKKQVESTTEEKAERDANFRHIYREMQRYATFIHSIHKEITDYTGEYYCDKCKAIEFLDGLNIKCSEIDYEKAIPKDVKHDIRTIRD